MSVFLSLRHGIVLVLSIPLEDKDQWVLLDVYTVFAYDIERTMGMPYVVSVITNDPKNFKAVFDMLAVFFDSDPIRKAMYESKRNRDNARKTVKKWISGKWNYPKFLEDKGIEPWTIHTQVNGDLSMFKALLPVYPNGPDSALSPTSNPSDQVRMPNPPTQAPDECPAFFWLNVLLLLGSMEATNDNYNATSNENDNEANEGNEADDDNEANEANDDNDDKDKDNDNAKSVLFLLGSIYLQVFMLVVDWLVEVMHSLH
jgi:hypothetical protein